MSIQKNYLERYLVERSTPIIGDISLAREMKAALQEAEDAERQLRSKDAKGREIMSPEEKGKRKEKEQQKAAEGRFLSFQC